MDVLFLCTDNATRSITAEALFRAVCRTDMIIRSAGLRPSGTIHPYTLTALKRACIDTRELHSKALSELPVMPEVVISLCMKEETAAFSPDLGKAVVVHWEMPDPSEFSVGAALWSAFCQTQEILLRRTGAMAALLDAEPGRDPAWLESVLSPIASM